MAIKNKPRRKMGKLSKKSEIKKRVETALSFKPRETTLTSLGASSISTKSGYRGKVVLRGPEVDKVKKLKIKVIGVGGGGSSIVSEIASCLKKASFLVADTDSRSFKKAPKNTESFHFGQDITLGSGTGMKPELGESAAKEAADRVKNKLKGIDLCIFVATLGGGTGSGSAPIFAELSKNFGGLNYGIFTLPFEFEGKRRLEIAKESLGKLRQNLNAFSIIENERIFKIIDRKTPFKTAFSQINKILTEGLEGLIEIIYQPGLINIDFADVETIFRGVGNLALLTTIESGGENRAKEALGKILNSPLYSYDIRGAKGILFDIAGDKNLSLTEMGEVSRGIFESAERGARIIFGVSLFRNFLCSRKNQKQKFVKNQIFISGPSGSKNKEKRGKIRVSLLATGCNSILLEKLFPTKPGETAPKIPFSKKENKIQEASSSGSADSDEEKTAKEEKKAKSEPKKKFLFRDLKNQVFAPKFERSQSKEAEMKNASQVRKNALQLKKEAEEAEKELLEKEKFWETPALFRQKKQNAENN